MKAMEHARVWQRAAERLGQISDNADMNGMPTQATALRQLTVFALTMANAYTDAAAVHAAADRIAERT